MTTGIEWCDETWNPIIGCSPVSSGCDNCYARTMAQRLHSMNINGYDKDVIAWDGSLQLVDSQLEKPSKLKKPKRIFLCSMSDILHENVKTQWIKSINTIMDTNRQHQYIILTKRPENFRDKFIENEIMFQPNKWIGITAETCDDLEKRMISLTDIHCENRFISFEPLLERITLTLLYKHLNPEVVKWVIVGGETGCNARPMHQEWVECIQQVCSDRDIPFFFKKWGVLQPDEDYDIIREFPKGLQY